MAITFMLIIRNNLINCIENGHSDMLSFRCVFFFVGSFITQDEQHLYRDKSDWFGMIPFYDWIGSVCTIVHFMAPLLNNILIKNIEYTIFCVVDDNGSYISCASFISPSADKEPEKRRQRTQYTMHAELCEVVPVKMCAFVCVCVIWAASLLSGYSNSISVLALRSMILLLPSNILLDLTVKR